MTIRILLFASLRERTGERALTREVAEGTTAADLLAELRRDLPALRASGRISLAVNEEYCEPERLLRDGDEVALIPPVSGGRGCLQRERSE
ncbi:MAG: molybdopterin converting factor subunit 1 [Deltaproteobacteria bacterium]|nr:molybdopterin converting factor subunit 1 [Deltaproteobacteria bacterium]